MVEAAINTQPAAFPTASLTPLLDRGVNTDAYVRRKKQLQLVRRCRIILRHGIEVRHNDLPEPAFGLALTGL